MFSHLEDDSSLRAKINFGGRPPIDPRKPLIKKTVPSSPGRAYYDQAKEAEEANLNLLRQRQRQAEMESKESR